MLNCAVIMGRLTADPELRTTPNGVSVTSFTVAVDRSYQKQGAEKQTDFIGITSFLIIVPENQSSIDSPVEMYRIFLAGIKARLVSGDPTSRISSGLHRQKRWWRNVWTGPSHSSRT